jgi:aerobic carbon-monoxide dehydrogenase medium subunit
MKPAPFSWHAPETVEEALVLLQQYGDDARPLAGGQSLIPVLNFRLARPAVLIDLNRIGELAGITEVRGSGGPAGGGLFARAVSAARDLAGGAGPDVLRIGAMTRQRHAERSALVAARSPLLRDALHHVAHPQIRNRGTVGGSVAHADPAAELPAVMLALGATIRLRGPAGERSMVADEFFTGLFATALRPGELLIGIDVPALPTGAGSAFLEVARRHGDYALAGVAAVIAVDAGGRCTHARLAFVNCGPGPLRATAAESALVGERIVEQRTAGPAVSDDVLHAAARAGLDVLSPPTDVHASADYRRHLARVLMTRAVAAAATRAAAAVHP